MYMVEFCKTFNFARVLHFCVCYNTVFLLESYDKNLSVGKLYVFTALLLSAHVKRFTGPLMLG